MNDKLGNHNNGFGSGSSGGGADADANKLLSIKFKFDMGEKERKVYHMSTKKKFHFVVVIYRFNKLVRSSSRMFI